MNDFKIMARILSAVKQCEKSRSMDLALFDPKVLGTDEATRDSLVIKLQKDGYVEGFFIEDSIDNMPYPAVLYNASNPSITIKGMTFIEENKPLKKAIGELKKAALSAAVNKITNGIMML